MKYLENLEKASSLCVFMCVYSDICRSLNNNYYSVPENARPYYKCIQQVGTISEIYNFRLEVLKSLKCYASNQPT